MMAACKMETGVHKGSAAYQRSMPHFFEDVGQNEQEAVDIGAEFTKYKGRQSVRSSD